jgi:hypothetical protein
MNTIDVDARRYAWCRGRVLWIMAMPVTAFEEDLQGALASGQDGLLRAVARGIGDACAVALSLILFYERPIPAPNVRVSWALERLGEHELGRECWALIAGSPADQPAGAIAERCERVIAGVRELVGEIPNVLTPEGYFPTIHLARDWLKLLDAVGEEGFLPRDWTGAPGA